MITKFSSQMPSYTYTKNFIWGSSSGGQTSDWRPCPLSLPPFLLLRSATGQISDSQITLHIGICGDKHTFHDTDADTDYDSPDAYILASDTRDFLKLFLWQAERHADEDVGEDIGVGVGVVECGL